MNNNDIINIINTVCQKIGVASEFGIVEFAKYTIGINACTIFIDLIVLALLILFYKRGATWSNTYFEDRDDILSTKCLFAGSAIVIGLFPFLSFCSSLKELIGFIASPTGATIHYIMEMLS